MVWTEGNFHFPCNVVPFVRKDRDREKDGGCVSSSIHTHTVDSMW